MFEKTVVGIDDRQGGRDALALAATLTAVEGGELLAVRAYPHETPVLGSTSDLLVREAACPVIAVPRPGGEG